MIEGQDFFPFHSEDCPAEVEKCTIFGSTFFRSEKPGFQTAFSATNCHSLYQREV